MSKPAEMTPLDPMTRTLIEGDVIEVLRDIYDPEIPVSIYDLGLIYGVHVGEDGTVRIEMTLTAPGCPVSVSLPAEVEHKVSRIPKVRQVTVDIVWDPPWTPERMSEEARLELDLL